MRSAAILFLLLLAGCGSSPEVDWSCSYRGTAVGTNDYRAPGQVSPPNLHVDGELIPGLVEACSEEFESAFATLYVRSRGGDVDTSVRIARLVEQNSADVVVVDSCSSGCALILLASAERAFVDSRDIIGLHHTPSAVLRLSEGYEASWRPRIEREAATVEKYLRRRGISPDALYRPFDAMRPNCIGTVPVELLDGWAKAQGITGSYRAPFSTVILSASTMREWGFPIVGASSTTREELEATRNYHARSEEEAQLAKARWLKDFKDVPPVEGPLPACPPPFD